ncbi:MAG: peptide deformylase [Acidimicrobiaceae bacterium]
MSYDIRTFGDPVLKTCAAEITNIDSKLVKLIDEMFEVMYQAPGIGLAAPQIGVQKQIFVYDVDDKPQVLINPKIVESSGEWVYDEGCLSIPGLYVEMLRPKLVLVEATNLDGNTIQIEADELLARLFQHEIDHLQGVLMFERMTPDQRKQALAEYRRREENKIESEPTHLRLS